MGKFNGKISAEFTPPKTWKLERTLSFQTDDLTADEIKCLKIIGVNIEPRYLDSRSGDIQHSVGNPSLSQKIINFQKVLSFREGLRQMALYFSDIDESN